MTQPTVSRATFNEVAMEGAELQPAAGPINLSGCP
jgi:hypothetical protein